MASNPLAWPQVDAFVSAVCAWGGYAGIAGRVRNNNTQTKIIGGFSSARAALANGHILQALSAIRGLHSLGEISFASKHLRMLSPVQCGVLDALVVGAGFGYIKSPASYLQYCSDCFNQAAALNAAGVLTSTLQPWNAGSVDMAVFAWIRSRSVRKPWNCRCAGGGHALSSPCALGAVPRSKENGDPVSVRAPKESPRKDSSSRVVDRVVAHPRNSAPAVNLFLQKMDRYFALKRSCGEGTPNIGALERLPLHNPDGTLNAKQDLVDEIAAQGGNFSGHPGFHPAIAPLRPTRRVSGQNYVGWRDFGNVDAAIRYLQVYFTVRACDGTTRQAIIAHGGPHLP
jgi:hypothetical protein